MTNATIDRDATATSRLAAEMREKRKRTRPLWRPTVSLGSVHRATGIDRSYLARIFGGKRRPGLATARALANHLKMTTDELLTRLGY